MATDMKDAITVITLTRHRPNLLARALASVRSQTVHVPVVHRIVIDDDEATLRLLEAGDHTPLVTWTLQARGPGVASGMARCAALRNLAVQGSTTPWIAFLDDDNEFEPDHLASLLALASAAGVSAVHSHRAMLHRDGRPYLEPRMPWPRAAWDAETLYALGCEVGMFERGSHILRDGVHPPSVRGRGLPTIDTGEWLLARSLLMRYPFATRYSERDHADTCTEDVKLYHDLVDAGVPIGCTERPTLRYYLDGYSNAPRTSAAQ